MAQTLFEQLSKEMATFAQNNNSYKKLQEFFLYELKLRCIAKRDLRKLCEEVEE